MRDPSGAVPVVPVWLHTRRHGEIGWRDRGLVHVPQSAVAEPGRALRLDAITYVVEDRFDDGDGLTVWARATREP